jgi:predicted RNase H-like nuclease (RuvC/YqgF family)
MNIELEEAKKILKEEEYKPKWGGYTHPYDYVCSAQYTVMRYWKNKVEKLEKRIKKLKAEIMLFTTCGC